MSYLYSGFMLDICRKDTVMNKTVKELVYEYYIKGYSIPDIADILRISKHTVKAQIASIRRGKFAKYSLDTKIFK